MSQNVCKKCGRVLPKSYTEDVCLHCKAEKNAKVANGLKIVGSLAAGAATIAGLIIGGKKFGNQSKK